MAVLLSAPILLSITLLISGLAKLGAREGTQDAMRSLRLPLPTMHASIASVLPVTEIVLALAIWIPAPPLQVLLTGLVAALMLAYLVIIARALTFEEQVHCSCFGTLASPTVSRTTLVRNVLLSVLGLLAVVAAASGAMTTLLVQAPMGLIGLGIALLIAIALTAATIGGSVAETDADAPTAPAPAAADPDEDELLDYERSPIPAAVLQQPDGRLITLTQLTAQRAALLVFVTEGCGPCERVLDHAEEWIGELEQTLQVRFVFSRPLDQLRERTTDRVTDHALHDLQFTARTALGGASAPSAVLLGADGQLAGGPVNGGSAVIEFVQEIREQLAEAQQSPVDGEQEMDWPAP
ncbi:MauE/DoxX family redox-associated membrane protein [Brachybacterium paraconglomeratum]|uniref:MauE/DoxX family redox-associated membrane protein n=1 Tax=Brachybacterium sp. GU-2 TaxID=3069708 RepID=UPI00280ACD7C|nr:MauE/DoxX family redox-associated membrane protein [Brachybacterium sp. GU-2]WME23003.1 MauE/DoxX family redox-associated membrane protein [Brachybacterium sp. GU-2]